MIADDFFGLIAALQDGVSDDTQWTAALDKLSEVFRGAAIFLGSTRRDGTVFQLSGHQVNLEWTTLVNGRLSGHDANPIFSTVSAHLRRDPVGTLMNPIILSSAIDAAAYHSSAIYREAIAPAGLEYAMVTVLHADADSALSLTLVRPESAGDFGPDDARNASAIGPHLLSSLRLRHQFAVARTSTLLLDRFDRAVLMVSESAKVVGGNIRGQRLLDSKDGLALVDGELRAQTPAETKRLHQAVGETDRAARGASLKPHATLRLSRRDEKTEIVVRALPLAPSVASTFGAGELATVALFIHDPDEASAIVEDIIADGLGLSRAEAAVAARMWEGDTIQQAASSLGISANTVKTHLKVIFEKAHVDRQAALVRKLALLVAAVVQD